MEKLPAVAGLQWIKQGFALFRRQPAEMSTLFVLYLSIALPLYIVPIIGLILLFALMPAFSMGFMQACADIERGKRVHPKVLFSSFRTARLKPLMLLGMVYLLALFLACAAALLFDDGSLWQTLSNATDSTTISDPKLVASMAQTTLFGSFVYLALIFPLWYAGPLIAWQGMSMGKAIFFSFFSIIRAIKAFSLYLPAWVILFVFVIFGVSMLLQILQIDERSIAFLIMIPFAVLLNVVRYCSFYPSYTQIFGAPHLSEEA